LAVNIEFAKKHWAAIVGGVFGLLVLYYLYETLSSSSSSPASTSSTDLSGGATQALALSSAADLTNAQTNAQTEVAAYSADVANNQTAAQLQASLATTAAQLAATKQQTSATLAIQLGAQQTALAQTKTTVGGAVNIQELQSQAAVDEEQIQGSTLTSLAKTAGQTQVQIAQAQEQIALSQISTQQEAIQTTASLISSGALNKGGQAGKTQTAALVAAEGQTGSAEAIAGAKGPPSTAAQVISGITGAASSILSGLFG